MIRKSMGISRSLAAIAVLAAAFGCNSDSAKNPRQQLQSPTSPLAGISITISASRSRLQVGDDATVSVVSVQALRTADWTPLPTGTDAAFSATLGAIDSPSGGRAATIDLVNGKGSITLYPGATEGMARVSVTIQGVTATLNIAIDPAGVPGPPAPTASTLNFVCSPSFFDEDAAGPFVTTCTSTVVGSDGQPFSGAGIYLTSNSGLGTFASSGSSIGSSKSTNGAGQAIDTLTVSKADLLAFPGSSFGITAHMGVTGGERTANFTVSILTGTPAPAATNLTQCASSVNALTDDGTNPPAVEYDVTVRDQYGDPYADATVLFESTLGLPVPSSATSAAVSGLAETSVDLVAADIENDSIASFTVTAKLITSSGTVTCTMPVTVNHVEAPAPDTVILSSDANFVVDDGGADEVLNLTALVLDQFLAAYTAGDANVTFTSSLAGISFVPLNGMTDGLGELDSVATVPAGSITAHPTNSFTITATVGTPSGTDTDTITITIIRPPIANFTFGGTSGLSIVNYFDTSTGNPTSWEWDFDVAAGASIDMTVQNPSAVDMTAYACWGGGSCSVKLTATNAQGTSSVTKIVVLPLP